MNYEQKIRELYAHYAAANANYAAQGTGVYICAGSFLVEEGCPTADLQIYSNHLSESEFAGANLLITVYTPNTFMAHISAPE